ncbi:hypothetical protein, partial [Bacillus mycoides]|uniref:hypothetical protein n=1 Tax=Bacillus mycoides TaxID=1405 RepID=UPI001C92C1F8
INKGTNFTPTIPLTIHTPIPHNNNSPILSNIYLNTINTNFPFLPIFPSSLPLFKTPNLKTT